MGRKQLTVDANWSIENLTYEMLNILYWRDQDHVLRPGEKKTDFQKETKNTAKGKYAPPRADQPMNNWSLSVDYAATRFSDALQMNDQRREADQWGATFRYVRDSDDWSLAFSVPMRRETNRGSFGAFDNIGLGLNIAPVWYVLHPQVHGLGLNLGGLVGYQHKWYDDKEELSDQAGDFALAEFDNQRSWHAGASIGTSVPISRLFFYGAASWLYSRNLTNEDIVGDDMSIARLTLGAGLPLGRGFTLRGDAGISRLYGANDIDRSSANYRISFTGKLGKGAFALNLSRTAGNSDYSTTAFGVVYSIPVQ